MKCGYVRVSTVEQNEARQVEALEKRGVEKFFIEKVSGKDTNRPKLQELLNFVREGDEVYIHDFSRLARSTKDLLAIIDELTQKNVALISNKENLDSSTPTGKLMITMIGAINEFERANLLERQREGIAIAKRMGKYAGRMVKEIDEDAFLEAYNRYQKREISKAEMCRVLNVSRPKMDRVLKDRGLM